jgi:hypothetical protein
MIYRKYKKHIKDDELIAFVTGNLSKNTKERVEIHLGHCEKCAQRIKDFYASQENFPYKEWESQRNNYIDELRKKVLSNLDLTSVSSTIIKDPQKLPVMTDKSQNSNNISKAQGSMIQLLGKVQKPLIIMIFICITICMVSYAIFSNYHNFSWSDPLIKNPAKDDEGRFWIYQEMEYPLSPHKKLAFYIKGQSYTGTESSSITFDDNNSSNPNGDVLQYRWDHDGALDTDWSINFATHGFYDNSTDNAELEVNDAQSTIADFAGVTVNSASPVVNVGDDKTINEGEMFISLSSFTDPRANTWTATVNYGDGSETQTLAINPDKTFMLSHLYTNSGTYTVTVNVSDDNSRVGTDTALVTVLNVAPLEDYMLGASVCKPQWSAPGDLLSYLAPVLRFQFIDTDPTLNQLTSIPPYPVTDVINPAYAVFNSQGELFAACPQNISRFKFDSLGSYQDALNISREIGDRAEGVALSSIGSVYDKTGDYQQAPSYYNYIAHMTANNNEENFGAKMVNVKHKSIYKIPKKMSKINSTAHIKVYRGENIKVKGQLEPQLENEVIKAKILRPDGKIEVLSDKIVTKVHGVFSYPIEADQSGEWKIILYWDGNNIYENTKMDINVHVISSMGKAIIVLGGGDRNIADWTMFNNVNTDEICKYVYNALVKCNLRKDHDIYFLNPKNTIDVDNVTETHLKYAIIDWAGKQVNSKMPLYIYLLSHGHSDQLLLDKHNSNESYLTRDKLYTWLYNVPSGLSMPVTIDACCSGNFVDKAISMTDSGTSKQSKMKNSKTHSSSYISERSNNMLYLGNSQIDLDSKLRANEMNDFQIYLLSGNIMLSYVVLQFIILILVNILRKKPNIGISLENISILLTFIIIILVCLQPDYIGLAYLLLFILIPLYLISLIEKLSYWWILTEEARKINLTIKKYPEMYLWQGFLLVPITFLITSWIMVWNNYIYNSRKLTVLMLAIVIIRFLPRIFIEGSIVIRKHKIKKLDKII